MSLLTVYINERLCCWLLSDRVAHSNSLHMFPNDTDLFNPVTSQALWKCWERSGSVVECLTRDRSAAGSSLIGVNALWS